MTLPQFVDLSAYQSLSLDFRAYKAWSASWDGVSRLAIRSSYGNGYRDLHFNVYRAGALADGIDSIRYYHYAYPQFNSPEAEADWQHAVVGDIRPQDRIILDIEENVAQATSEWAYRWLVRQQHNYPGRHVGLYTFSAYIPEHLHDPRLAAFPLWLANWQFSPDERPPVPAPWTNYVSVQFTDAGTNIPGIPGRVDVSIEFPSPSSGGADMLQITDPFAAAHFTEIAGASPTRWRCKQTNHDVIGGILTYYRQIMGAVRLPNSDEIYTPGKTYVLQLFESGVIVYDPNKESGDDPGFGNSYVAKFDSPFIRQLVQQPGLSDAVKADIVQLAKDAGVSI